MKPNPGALASLAVRRAAISARRAKVLELHAAHPGISTDEIADILGVDRSTIRRDRKSLGIALARASAQG